MDLFTYLLGKKGKNSLVHKGDLFAYLLGKRTPKEVKTASGTTISISDVTSTKIVSLTLSKESTQDGTPTPENPVEVKTVKGYRNLFDKDNLIKGWIRGTDGQYFNQYTDTYNCTNYIEVTPNTTYTVNLIDVNGLLSGGIVEYDSSKNYISYVPENQIVKTFTTSNTTKYIRLTVRVGSKSNIIFLEGNTLFPYVPYGTNWIYTAVSNGTDTNYYTIPLNDNEIAGIGDYKDELIVDKNGKCWLNKKTSKVVLDGSESSWWNAGGQAPFELTITDLYRNNDLITVMSDYYLGVSYSTNWNNYNYLITCNTTVNPSPRIRLKNIDISNLEDFKIWLSTHNTTVYYALATPQLIDLNYTVDVRLFNGVNNISNSDDMDMTLKYY